MGYRSDVGIKIYGDSIDELKLYYNQKLSENTSEDFKSDLEYLLTESKEILGVDLFEENAFQFYVESVKWYDGYPFVEFFKDLMDKAKELNFNVEFVRIGEDYCDIEVDYSGDDLKYDLGVKREIIIYN